MRALLFVAALGVRLGANDASLVDETRAVSASSPVDDLQILKLAVNQDMVDALQGMSNLKSEAGAAIGEKIPPLEETVSTSRNGLDKLAGEAEAYKERANRVSTALKERADNGSGELNRQNIDVTSLAEETLTYIEDKVDAMKQDVRDTSDRNTDELTDALEAQSGEMMHAMAEQKEMLTKEYESGKEIYTEVGEDVRDTAPEDKDLYMEQKDLAKELGKSDKVIKKNTIKNEKAVTKTAKKVNSLTDRTRTTWVSQATVANKNAAKQVDKIEKQSTRMLKQAESLGTQISEEIEDGADDLTGDLDDESKDMKKDIYSEAQGIKKDDAAAFLDVSTTELDTITALQMVADEGEGFERDSDEMFEESQETLDDTLDEAESKSAEANTDMLARESEQTTNLESAIDQMKDKVSSVLSDGTSKVEDTVTRAATLAEGKVSSGIIDLTKSIEVNSATSASLHAQINTDLTVSKNQLDRIETAKAVAEKMSKDTILEIKAAAEGVHKKIGEVEAAVLVKQQAAGAQFEQDQAKAASETAELINTVEKDLIKKVDALHEEAGGQFALSNREISRTAGQGSDILTGMASVVENIGKMKTHIQEGLPKAIKRVLASIASNDEELASAKTALSVAKDASGVVVKEQEDIMRKKDIDGLEFDTGALDQELKEAGDDVATAMAQITGMIDTQNAQSMSDVADGSAYQDRIRKSLQASLVDANKGTVNAENSATELAEAVRISQNTIQDGINSQEREGTILQKNVAGEYLAAHEVASTEAMKQVQIASDATRTEFGKVATQAALSTEASMDRAKGYTKENEKGYNGLKAQIDELQQKMLTVTAAASTDEVGNTNRMSALQKHMAVLIQKTEAAARDENNMLDSVKNELTGLQQHSIKGMSDTESTRLQQFQSNENALLGEEKVHERLLAAGTNSVVIDLQNTVKAGLGGVEQLVEDSRTEADDLRAGEADARAELKTEASGVAAAVTFGEDAVMRSEQDEETALGGAINDDLTGMEGALGAFGTAKKFASSGLDALGDEFNKDMDKYKAFGESQTSELTQQIMRLVNNSPDNAKMFKSDTADAAGQMVAAHERIDQADTLIKAALKQYDGRVKIIGETREEQAAAMHNTISELKRTVVDRSEQTVDTIDSVKQQMAATETEMNSQMSDFKAKLQGLGSTTVEHGAEDIIALESKTSSLEIGHARLLDWKENFRHHTAAWREEVENLIRSMGSGVSQGALDEERAKLEQESSINNAVRNMQLRVETTNAAAKGGEAEEFNKVATAMGKGMDNAMKAEEGASETRRIAEQAADEELKRYGADENKEMENLEDRREKLKFEADGLTNESEGVTEEMKSLMKLPSLTVSDQNQETEGLIDNFNSRVHKLKSSLVEESSTSLRGTTDEAQEEALLAQLNAELENENGQLSGDNQRLSTEIGSAKEKVDAKRNQLETRK